VLCAFGNPLARAQENTELDQWQDRVDTELPKSFRDFPDNRYRDPAVDRVILFPSAETQPEGVWYASGFGWTRLGVGVTDDLQLGIAAGVPMAPAGSATATYNVLRSRFRLAVVGGAMSVIPLFVVASTGDALAQRPPYHVLHGGLVGQLCFDLHCRSSGVLGVHGGYELSLEEPIALPHAGLVVRLNDYFALLGEAALTRWQPERAHLRGWLLAPMQEWAALGVRIDRPTARRMSGDISIVAAHEPGEILIFPWANITFRTDPIAGRPRPNP
jgi:hypothetical protein